jgi:hypothetical protein
VRYRSAMQMQTVAVTGRCQYNINKINIFIYTLLIGANQRMILCKVFVVNEQIMPMMHSNPIDTKTVSSAVLEAH